MHAFVHIYKSLNIGVEIAKHPSAIAAAEALILPGVGSFDWAMTRLNQSGLREALEVKVLKEKVPLLGVCVGMQMLAERSEEGQMSGLGWIAAEVRRLKVESESGKDRRNLRLPHMGWNDVQPTGESPLFQGIYKPQFYFLHSYYFESFDRTQSLGSTEYDGIRFTAAVGRGNIHGVQFHPEKSHGWGIRLLKNFASEC